MRLRSITQSMPKKKKKFKPYKPLVLCKPSKDQPKPIQIRLYLFGPIDRWEGPLSINVMDAVEENDDEKES